MSLIMIAIGCERAPAQLERSIVLISVVRSALGGIERAKRNNFRLKARVRTPVFIKPMRLELRCGPLDH